jgi:S-adenosylmethionine synthetase
MVITVRHLGKRTIDDENVEIVERKGLGHPDTLCDALAERLSQALCRFYDERFGLILHHNVDKVLLWGGVAEPNFGGGKVIKPIEIYFSGRATTSYRGADVPVADLAAATLQEWFAGHFHALDSRRHVKLHCLVRPGSPDLVELFLRQQKAGEILANDTSCGVGFAPWSELERIVYCVERALNAADFKKAHPETGEDVKVMGVRRGDDIRITVACAMIGGELSGIADYFEKKEQVAALARKTAEEITRRTVTVDVNTADSRETGSVYLTVTGTSAEGGDDGEAGRGNRANGLITPFRPMTLESAAGKNPISHVGKLYNIAATLIAEDIVSEIEGVRGVHCHLVSQIGHPISQPQIADIGFYGDDAAVVRSEQLRIDEIVHARLGQFGSYWRDLVAGTLRLDRWPIHAS